MPYMNVLRPELRGTLAACHLLQLRLLSFFIAISLGWIADYMALL